MFDGRWRHAVDRTTKPVGTALVRAGITADVLTIFGLAMSVVTAFAVGTGHSSRGSSSSSPPACPTCSTGPWPRPRAGPRSRRLLRLGGRPGLRRLSLRRRGVVPRRPPPRRDGPAALRHPGRDDAHLLPAGQGRAPRPVGQGWAHGAGRAVHPAGLCFIAGAVSPAAWPPPCGCSSGSSPPRPSGVSSGCGGGRGPAPARPARLPRRAEPAPTSPVGPGRWREGRVTRAGGPGVKRVPIATPSGRMLRHPRRAQRRRSVAGASAPACRRVGRVASGVPDARPGPEHAAPAGRRRAQHSEPGRTVTDLRTRLSRDRGSRTRHPRPVRLTRPINPIHPTPRRRRLQRVQRVQRLRCRCLGDICDVPDPGDGHAEAARGRGHHGGLGRGHDAVARGRAVESDVPAPPATRARPRGGRGGRAHDHAPGVSELRPLLVGGGSPARRERRSRRGALRRRERVGAPREGVSRGPRRDPGAPARRQLGMGSGVARPEGLPRDERGRTTQAAGHVRLVRGPA